ncbi:MAG: glycosyltransferase family 39 protein [Burkholderiales bacterium]|nr:glycosyltransferase family 39 protein [Anaerolineae bacterium]
MQNAARWRSFFGATFVFLLIAASRISTLSLTDRELHTDEVWAVWQTLGTPVNVALETTWPPGFASVVYLWKSFVGLHPIALRLLSVLLFMLGCAFVYRVMHRLRGEQSALIALLAYSSITLSAFFATQLRSYILVYSLLPLAFWLTLRYFDRPRLRRALPLALTLAAMFYTSYTSIFPFALLGLYTLVVYRRAVWRWWLPALIALPVALPEMLRVSTVVSQRAQNVGQNLGDILPALGGLYRGYIHQDSAVWMLLFVVATAFLIWQQRPLKAQTIGVLLWTLTPVLLYLFDDYLGLYYPIYSWFVVLGLVLWLAWGLSYTPRLLQWASLVFFVLMLFTPIRLNAFTTTEPRLGRSLEWLTEHAQWGDVIVIDPNWHNPYCDCIQSEAFDYFAQVFFPQGFTILDHPRLYDRRVWYLSTVDREDPDTLNAIRDNRIEGIFSGPATSLLRLYEGPPDIVGTLFENGMRFHGADVIDEPPGLLVRREGDSIRLRLWWSVDEPPQFDYSVALHIYGNGEVIAQSDSAPQLVSPDDPSETSRWTPERFYIEERELQLPLTLSTTTRPIYLVVYQSWDGVRIPAPGVNENTVLPIYTLHTKAW